VELSTQPYELGCPSEDDNFSDTGALHTAKTKPQGQADSLKKKKREREFRYRQMYKAFKAETTHCIYFRPFQIRMLRKIKYSTLYTLDTESVLI
jgi:hypothetical protein